MDFDSLDRQLRASVEDHALSPQEKVELQGKVDKDWNEFEIDVKQVIKLNKKPEKGRSPGPFSL